MQAVDIMTPGVITGAPNTPIAELIRLMLSHGVSAIPIVDRDVLVGIVSEGDLIRRAELGSERGPSYWRVLIGSTARLAADYVHTHGRTAQQVMTSPVITVADTALLGEIAALLETHRIGRVPVLREGRLLGIVSRANLLRVLADRIVRPLATDPDATNANAVSANAASANAASDRRIRDAVLAELRAQPWGGNPQDGNVMVEDGVVHLWGYFHSAAERQARIAAAESTEGVRSVEDHMDRWIEPDPFDRPNWPSPGRP